MPAVTITVEICITTRHPVHGIDVPSDARCAMRVYAAIGGTNAPLTWSVLLICSN